MKKILFFIFIYVLSFNNYQIKNGKVYYGDLLIEKANVQSFKILRDRIGYDDKNLFIEENLVDKNNEIVIENTINCSAPFEIVYDRPVCNQYDINYNSGKRFNFFSYKIQDEDETKYFEDMNKFLEIMKSLNYTVKKDVDFFIFSNDYKEISRRYLSNGKKIYYIGFSDGQELKDVDVNTFEILENPYSKDKNNVYFMDVKIENVDAETFEVLGKGYSKDKNNVYFEVTSIGDENTGFSIHLTAITAADVKTFRILGKYNDGKARDKNNYYKNGEIIKKK